VCQRMSYGVGTVSACYGERFEKLGKGGAGWRYIVH